MKTLTDAEYANLTERIQNLRAQLAERTKERDAAMAEIAACPKCKESHAVENIQKQLDAALARAEAGARDTARLEKIEYECWDLRCENIMTGGDDCDVGWVVIEHHMAKPHEREISRGETPRAAIDAAGGTEG